MPLIFGHDQFLGQHEGRWHARGFSVARLVPTVAEHAVQEHTHAEAHFVLLLRGSYLSSAHGAPVETRGPLLVYNPPGTVHRDRFGDLHNGLFVTVTVEAATLRQFADAIALPDHACALGTSAWAIARRLAAAGGQVGTTGDLVVESLCAELLGATAAHGRSMVYRQAPAWLWRARECLHDDCGAQLGLADVAAAAGVHPVYLTRAFRRHFGCTPGDYLRRCRLAKAAALLQARQHDGLAGVAGACGYFDQAHFSRAFKLAFGLSPARYHKAMRQGHPAQVCQIQDRCSPAA
ncbi:helix-turn-helix transcriptional regulator [Frateuria hangzhouensis]|uniref:helix-turn-helix transcriptional regulator n=1 Tax=Frateuria hangzhouensis TaxID=2995589 RepID=UPI002260A841|nr:AraC family transcriptional regulator [Frateuria sp. STR12]MCX7515160.1 AraC family transcriptional regulator [Frateuria sp. STR12]